MISLADFQPLKTTLISSPTRVFNKVHAILIEEVPVQSTLYVWRRQPRQFP